MKKLLVVMAVVLTAAVSHSQGTFDFNNTGAGQGIYLPASMTGGTAFSAGPGADGALQLFYNGNALLAQPLGFFTVAGATHWANLPPTITVPGATPGTAGTIEVRVWDNSFADWAASKAGLGFFSDNDNEDWTFTTSFGGPDPAGGPPFTAGTSADFNNSPNPGFQLSVVPEPSTIVLGVLGAAALLLRRRK